ncbi:hypothetical protein MTR67_030527 [Solanum verrucosum]|uniref:Tf2-1-like SH3-like domain-containing protein n=1 Tax=Solanum verrucosum TaxID=315347 RepID=A0AAF0RB53_SOLVR|nr:hypothetical protein MTR67_030527 [Solanum verrucosum]
MKGVMRLRRGGTLSPRYIGTFEILKIVGDISYELVLPLIFSSIHLVFHISMLCRYIFDESYVPRYDSVQLDNWLTRDGHLVLRFSFIKFWFGSLVFDFRNVCTIFQTKLIQFGSVFQLRFNLVWYF